MEELGTGHISQGEKDYKVILSRPSALADFERLLSRRQPTSKILMRWHLHTQRSSIEELSQSLRESKEGVATQGGCIVSQQPFSIVLGRIEAGDDSNGK